MLVEPNDVARRDRDRALIERHCAGDRAVFPLIVREHYRALLAHAHRRLGNRGEAEDAVQETFERAYRGLCRVNGEYRIGAWLHRIVANVCTDHAARRRVQRSLPERIGIRHAVVPDAADHVSDPTVVRAVQEALAALPASQRETFWLHEMNGLTYPEVAEQLGISEDNARARVHRAKVALRRSLGRARDAVAAVIMLPFGARALHRHGKVAADGLSGAPHAARHAAPAGLHAGLHQVAYAVSASPAADFAVSSASGGPNAFVVLATSVATVIGGVLAAPMVTGSSGPSNAPATASVAAPSDSGTTAVDTAASAEFSAVVATGEIEALAAPAGGTAVTAVVGTSAWIAAGAEATGEVDWGEPSPEAPDPAANPGAAACSWLAGYPDIRAALPGSAPVLGTLDPAAGAGTGVDISFATATVLRIAERPDGPTTREVPVTLRVQACLARGASALVVEVVGPDGKTVQLRAPLVMRFNNDQFVFRGGVTPLSGGATYPLPWGLPDRFVALLTMNRTAGSAVLDVAFIGDKGATLTPTDPTPTTSAPSSPSTTVPGSGPSPSTSTTLPSPSTTTTLPVTSTTQPDGSNPDSP